MVKTMAKVNLKISKELWLLGLILGVGAFLRLYKIDQYMTFLGDEGRDVLIVSRFVKHFDLMLVGPGTSVGNMYLGPLYYYLMAPSLLLAGFSPVGPAVQIAILGVATVAFVWWIGRQWWDKTAGLVAAALYAVAPTVIVYSRSSWNPNIMPFFALLCIYAIWRVWTKYEFKWLIVLGVAYALVLQSHYLGLLLAPTLFLFWFLTFRNLRLIRNSSLEIGHFLRKSLFGFLIFAGLMSPLVIFDTRHGWRNFAAIKTFFTVREETISIKPWNAIPKIWPIFNKAVTDLVAAGNKPIGFVVSLVLSVFIVWLILRQRKLAVSHQPLAIVLVWLGFALFGLGLYKGAIYDHYFGFFFAAPFLFLGGLVQTLLTDNKRKITKYLFFFCFLLLVAVNLINNPLKFPPNQQLRRAKEVAQKIAEESKGERFNLAVIAERNYEDGYQYFLEVWGKPVIEIDAQKPETITNQLFVVCEMIPEKCDPTHSPKAEVANFGWSKIENRWEVFGARLFKLVHTK